METQDVFLLILGVIISSLVNYIVIKAVNKHRDRNLQQRRSFEESVSNENGDARLRNALTIDRNVNREEPQRRPPAVPETPRQTIATTVRSRGIPELPAHSVQVNRGIDSYPRCPIHRCGNKIGQSQKIYYDPARNQYRCYRGHYFYA